MIKQLYIIVVTALVLGSQADAQQDKSKFTLFNPTPRDQMREMDTDRPDVTESPISVDAGHFQLEMSFAEFTHDHDKGVRTDTLDVAPINFKVGLLNNVDVQFVFTPYERIETNDNGDRDVADGFSDDTQIRLKINLWGNDASGTWQTALALMPFVKFPTGSSELSNDHVEGGLIVPFNIDLPTGAYLALMAEFDLVYNDADDDYGVDFVHTASVGRDIPYVKNLGGFIEYVGIAPCDTGKTYQAIFSGGFTYSISEDIRLDCGGRRGISDSADDFTVFTGVSIRH